MVFRQWIGSLSGFFLVTRLTNHEFRVTLFSRQSKLERKEASNGPVKDLSDCYGFNHGARPDWDMGSARALILKPQLIIADEPVSALDVSVQAQVLQLLKDLQDQFHLTYLFITHDLAVVRHISNRVAVMYLGVIVESATTEELFNNLKHPYTEALMSAVPIPDPDYRKKRILLPGDVPSPVNPPSGCRFHPRCTYSKEVCRTEPPVYHDLGNEHFVRCHFADQLDLQPLRTQ